MCYLFYSVYLYDSYIFKNETFFCLLFLTTASAVEN